MATRHPTVDVDPTTVSQEDRPEVGLDHLTVVPANYDPDCER